MHTKYTAAQLLATIRNMADGVRLGVEANDLTHLEAAVAAAAAACAELRHPDRRDRLTSMSEATLSWQITAALREFEQ